MLLKKNDIDKNPFKSFYKKDKKLSNFLDKIDDAEGANINEALLELFIVFDIEFTNVSSIYLLNLIRLLRPAYASRLPKIEKLSNEILSQVYAKHINDKLNYSRIEYC